jgi:hypothetical protein
MPALKGRDIPAQGRGGWRALLLAVSPEPWVTNPEKVEPCRGDLSWLHDISRLQRSISVTT